jgi:hypothetical protein
MRSLRIRFSQLVWLVCVACALVLAAGALIVAIVGTARQPGNDVLRFVLQVADHLDFGTVSTRKVLIDLDGPDSDTKETMLNWGVAAIVWVVFGWGVSVFLKPEAVQRGQRV